jgi:hypothetical protein
MNGCCMNGCKSEVNFIHWMASKTGVVHVHGWQGTGVTLVSIKRGIRKVRTTQHRNPEFGHTQGEV